MARDERPVCEISLGKQASGFDPGHLRRIISEAGWAVEGSPATGPPDARIFVNPQLSDLRSAAYDRDAGRPTTLVVVTSAMALVRRSALRVVRWDTTADLPRFKVIEADEDDPSGTWMTELQAWLAQADPLGRRTEPRHASVPLPDIGVTSDTADKAGGPADLSASGHVFISYARTDQDYVDRLEQHLAEAGIETWVDRRGISAGDRWDNTLRDALDACSALIVVMTPTAEESRGVRREILYVEDDAKPIVPVLLDGKRWWSLAEIQYEDVRGGGMPGDQFVEKLRQRLME